MNIVEIEKILREADSLTISVNHPAAVQVVEAAHKGAELLALLLPKAPVFKHGENSVFVEHTDGHGDVQVNKWAEWCCPNCGWFVGEQYIPRRHNQQKCKYCDQCGQAIDWAAVEGKEMPR